MFSFVVIIGGLLVYIWFLNSKIEGKRPVGIVLSIIGFILLCGLYSNERNKARNYLEYYGEGAYSMSPDLYAVILLGIGILVMGLLLIIKGKDEPTKKPSKSDYDYYWKLEDEIFKQCFDKNTDEFNWKIWFDRRDEIIHTAPPEVLDYIDSEFRYIGRLQIYKINAILSNHLLSGDTHQFAEGIRILRRDVSTDIYINLSGMFSFKNGVYTPDVCPKQVIEYVDGLHDFFYDTGKPVSMQEAKKLIDLGRSITQ